MITFLTQEYFTVALPGLLQGDLQGRTVQVWGIFSGLPHKEKQ
jgi:hypothetical protein